jgi:hypothetical protein
LEDVGTVGGDISGAVALKDDALDGRAEKVGDGVASDGREETQEDDVAIEDGVNAELDE